MSNGESGRDPVDELFARGDNLTEAEMDKISPLNRDPAIKPVEPVVPAINVHVGPEQMADMGIAPYPGRQDLAPTIVDRTIATLGRLVTWFKS